MFALSDTQAWFFDTVAVCLSWHVPVFITITGMLMLQPERRLTPRLCVRKYAARLVLAIFLFGVPFSFLELFFFERTVSLALIWKAFVNTLNGESWGHLWYLYTMVGVYLFLPAFKGFTDGASRRAQEYVLLLLLLYDFCIPLFDSIAGTKIGFESPITAPVFYLLLGRYLADETPRVFRSKKLCAVIPALFIGVAAIFERVSSNEIPLLPVLVPFVTCCVVCLFKGVHVPERWKGALWKLDRLCFGVYLTHPVFMNLVYKVFHLTPANYKAYPLMMVVFFSAFTLISFFASWVMSLIPPLKKYVL